MVQFSIRDLLLLVIIVALALGWWLDKRPVAGRFQITSSNNRTYVLDTATGQIWSDYYSPDAKIHSEVPPIKLPK